MVCLRRINTEGREPRRHGEFLERSFAHGNENTENEKESRNVSAGRNSYFILRDFVSRTSPCLSAAGMGSR